MFQRKDTPAALPTLTVISRVAWTVMLAGAMRVSWLTSCPSARTEIHVFSLARMTRVMEAAGFAAGAAFAGVRMVTSLVAELLTAGCFVSGVAVSDEL